MTLDPESVAIAPTTIVFAVLFLLAAKIWRECATEALRRKLRNLEIELFELARHGDLPAGHPAYVMVRDSIVNLSASAHEMSMTRLLLTAVLGGAPTRPETLTHRRRQWEAALGQVPCKDTRLNIVGIRERVHREVSRCIFFGPVPTAPLLAVTRRLTAARRRACLRLAHPASFVEIDAKGARRLSVPA